MLKKLYLYTFPFGLSYSSCLLKCFVLGFFEPQKFNLRGGGESWVYKG